MLLFTFGFCGTFLLLRYNTYYIQKINSLYIINAYIYKSKISLFNCLHFFYMATIGHSIAHRILFFFSAGSYPSAVCCQMLIAESANCYLNAKGFEFVLDLQSFPLLNKLTNTSA